MFTPLSKALYFCLGALGQLITYCFSFYVSCLHLDQVRNTRAVNRTGQPTGFRLVPGSNCLPFALPEAKFLRRAGFLKHNLWVTPYKSDEKFPGGEFPNQNPRLHEGLATWVKKDRPLEETDIVLWYTFALHTDIEHCFFSLQLMILTTEILHL